MRTLWWTHTGLKITYEYPYLVVSDLNPETRIKNHFYREQLFWLGLKMIWTALSPWR